MSVPIARKTSSELLMHTSITFGCCSSCRNLTSRMADMSRPSVRECQGNALDGETWL